MRSYSCYYRSVKKEQYQEWSESFRGGDWGGDVAGRGGTAAVGVGDGDGDIWFSKKDARASNDWRMLLPLKSPEAFSRSSQ